MELNEKLQTLFDTSGTNPGRLRPLLLVIVAVTIGISVIRIIVEAVQYSNARADDTTGEPPVTYGHVWVMIVSGIHIIMLSINALHMHLTESSRVENRIVLFLQIAFGTLVINFASSNEGWGDQYWLLVLPALGVVMDIPILVNVVWTIITSVFQTLMLLDLQYEFSFRQFEQRGESIPQALSFTVGMLTSLTIAKVSMDALRQEQELRNTDSSIVIQAVDMLTDMNVAAAQKLIGDELDRKEGDELLLSLEALRSNLALYRPYLPYALLASGDQFDDDDESDDDSVSESESRSSANGRQDDVDQVNKTFKRRRGTILHVYNLSLPNEAKEASDIAAKFCEAVLARVTDFQGVVDTLTPNSIMVSFNCHAPCVLHEQQACRCALAIAADLQQHQQRGMEWCICLAGGYNLVGSVGSAVQRARVVCGENVDLVLRLPTLAIGRLNSRIVISEEMTRSGGIDTVPIDIISPDWQQEGRSREITLYELRGAKREDEPKPLATAYSVAFAALRQGDLQTALTQWKNYCERMPNDHQAMRLYRICLSFQERNKPLPQPFQRHEIHWEKFESQTDPASKQQVRPAEEVKTANAVHDDLLKAREKLVPKEAVEQEDTGFGFGLFLAPESDGDDDAAEDVDGNVPKEFFDGSDNKWKRSDKTIGFGAFSTVYLALGAEGILVAMKCFSMAAKKSSFNELQAEVSSLSTLRSDYIVGYVSCAAPTQHHFIILMEYVSGGSLAQLLSQFGRLPLPAIRRYMKDICLGIRYLHSHNITHCDMKPHNVLLSNDGMCKLSDFGSAMNTNAEGGDEDTIVRGTSWYLAPEAARGEVCQANDIWSIGATLMEMISGHHPWHGRWKDSEAKFIAQLGKDDTMKPIVPDHFPEAAREFCEACFERDPQKRPTAQQLLMTPFLMMS